MRARGLVLVRLRGAFNLNAECRVRVNRLFALHFEGGGDLFAGGLENFESGEAFVVGGHEVPRCGGAVGQGEHVADGGLVRGPLAAVAPVLGVDLVLLVVGLLPEAEAPQLFRLR